MDRALVFGTKDVGPIPAEGTLNKKSRMPPLLLLIIGGSILTVGDILFKFYAESQRFPLYAFGIFTYVIGLLFLVQTFKTENIATASAIFVIANILTLLAVSHFYFHEQISVLQTVGLILAIIAIFFLEIGK